MKDDVMKLDGIVEVDETYVGGPRKRKPGRPAPGDREKTPMIALVERGGRVRAFPLARVTGDNVQDVIRREVSLNAHMIEPLTFAFLLRIVLPKLATLLFQGGLRRARCCH